MKVLLVEDDVKQSELLCSLLVSEGFSVTPVFDGYEAISLLKIHKYDMIVSDVVLGSSPDGFQVYKAFKDSGSGDFILYTSSSYPDLASLAKDLGILTFISNSKENIREITKAVIERLNESVKKNTEVTNKLLGSK